MLLLSCHQEHAVLMVADVTRCFVSQNKRTKTKENKKIEIEIERNNRDIIPFDSVCILYGFV